MLKFRVGDVVRVQDSVYKEEYTARIYKVDEGPNAYPYKARVLDVPVGSPVCFIKKSDRVAFCDDEVVQPRLVDALAEKLGVNAPPGDPKALYGQTKPNLALIPPVASAHEALALEDGAIKYGPFNWRYNNVEVMTYLAAAKRHIDAFIDGEDYTLDTLVHNLGAARAGLGIVMDAMEQGTATDNRPKAGKGSVVQERLKEFKTKHWPERKIDWKKGVK